MDIKEKIAALGGPAAVAAVLNITSQAVSQWADIPHKRVLDLEYHTRGGLSRYDLRPDLYGPDPRTNRGA